MKTFTITSEEVMERLENLLADPEMVTIDAYSPDTANYPSNRISFIEQHVRYLKTHKNVDPEHYLSNLELMIKK